VAGWHPPLSYLPRGGSPPGGHGCPRQETLCDRSKTTPDDNAANEEKASRGVGTKTAMEWVGVSIAVDRGRKDDETIHGSGRVCCCAWLGVWLFVSPGLCFLLQGRGRRPGRGGRLGRSTARAGFRTRGWRLVGEVHRSRRGLAVGPDGGHSQDGRQRDWRDPLDSHEPETDHRGPDLQEEVGLDPDMARAGNPGVSVCKGRGHRLQRARRQRRVEAIAYNVPDASATEAGLFLIPEDVGERAALARRIVNDTMLGN